MNATPSPADARSDLATADRLDSRARTVGRRPQAFGFAVSVWAGVFAALIAWESRAWPLVLAGGVLGYVLWRRQRAALALEPGLGRPLFTIALGLAVGAVFVAGNVAFQVGGVVIAPYLSGLTVALTLGLLFRWQAEPGKSGA